MFSAVRFLLFVVCNVLFVGACWLLCCVIADVCCVLIVVCRCVCVLFVVSYLLCAVVWHALLFVVVCC